MEKIFNRTLGEKIFNKVNDATESKWFWVVVTMIFLLSIFGPSIVSQGKEDSRIEIKKKENKIKKKYEKKEEKKKTPPKKFSSKKKEKGDWVKVTCYNPVKEQCDENPHITADNTEIPMHRLKKHGIRWIAISRDLMKSGKYKFGDRVVMHSEDPYLDGKDFIIHDVLNSRFVARVDILTYPGNYMSTWERVKIEKIEG